MGRVIPATLPASEDDRPENARTSLPPIGREIHLTAAEAKHIAPFHIELSKELPAKLCRLFERLQSRSRIGQAKPGLEWPGSVVLHPQLCVDARRAVQIALHEDLKE